MTAKTVTNWMTGLTPWAAVAFATLLVLLGGFVAIQTESDYRQQQTQQTDVQARIIAASVAPALMFDDPKTVDEYLDALVANPALTAAAVYNPQGRRLAWFGRAEEPPTVIDPTRKAPTFVGDGLDVIVPAERDGETLGFVLVRSVTESLQQRLLRYVGVAILILLAALLVAVFGIAQGSLRRANAELAARATELQGEMDQRKLAEEALLQSRKLEAMGQLTGGVAHDFNNLLQVLKSGLAMLDRNPEPSRAQRIMQGMRQAVDRGANLTRQLLSFARRQPLELQSTDIGRLVGGMRELLERSLRADILVEIEVAPNLTHAMTDPSQLELAIINTAVNARDAMPTGGVLTISCMNVQGDGASWVEISVRDTGSGMSPEVVERVFEPFFTTKAPGQGTGLGLSQVYGIARQSGGNVRIESVVNEGTTVIITLPAADGASSAAHVKPSSSVLTGELAGKSILVVEDDDSVAASVLEMLHELGCRFKRAPDAATGLKDYEAGSFDLVFSDILMPGAMNGLEFAREIHRRNPSQRIVLTTGYSGGAQSGDLGFPVLRKPYGIEALRAALGKSLEMV
jgi:signal transduction histidine kinase/CheY-like chemotaxis protein